MAIIGELQNYGVGLPPGFTLISADWDFGEDAANFIDDYEPNNNSAVIVPVPTFSGGLLQLYYFQPDDVGYTVNVVYENPEGGQGEEQLEGDVNYIAPVVDDTEIGGAPDGWSISLGGPAGTDLLTLGDAAGVAGFDVTSDVLLPEDEYGDGAGLVAYAQMVSGTVTYTPFDGAPIQLVIPAATVLDSTFPYEPATYGLSGQKVVVSMEDSPSYWLPRNGCQVVSVDLAFTTFLMYQPATPGISDIWVSLGYASWTASGSASKPGPDDDWLLVENNVERYPFEVMYGPPTWTTNVQTLSAPFLAELRQAFGPPPLGGFRPRRARRTGFIGGKPQVATVKGKVLTPA